jgi:hypothetical protein
MKGRRLQFYFKIHLACKKSLEGYKNYGFIRAIFSAVTGINFNLNLSAL